MRRALPIAALAGLAIAAPAAGRVAADGVTIAVRDAIVRYGEQATLFGAITTGEAGQLVTLQEKACGVPGGFFHSVNGTQTANGGTWTIRQLLRSNTVFRVVWCGAVSSEVSIQHRAGVSLFDRGGGRFGVSAGTITPFKTKRVVIERLDLRRRAWVAVKPVVVESGSYTGYGERKGVRISLPKGTTIRAVLPLSEARPCHLAGYSSLVRM